MYNREDCQYDFYHLDNFFEDREFIKEYIEYFFTGELKRKIRIFKYKILEGIPEDFYYTLHSSHPVEINSGRTNNIHDPTGEAVMRLMDVELNRINCYKLYSEMQSVLSEFIKGLSEEDLYILKVYVEYINKTQSDLIEELKISSLALRKKIDEIHLAIVKKLKSHDFGIEDPDFQLKRVFTVGETP